MTNVRFVNPRNLNRDEFLTPFDKVFDELMNKTFPTFKEETGVSFNQGAYPKVNVYEYDDKVGIVAEIPGLDKKNVSVEVEEDVLIISGDKHGFDDSPEKLETFEKESVAGGTPICMKQSWNKQCQHSTMSIDRLSDIIGKVFG